VQVPLAQITWYHHISLLAKVKDTKERAFYIVETAKNEWSRDVMLLQIQSKLYERDGKALNNFERTLPDYQSDLAKSIFKDPYNLDFLMLSRKAKEVEIENLLGVASYELEQLVKENIDKLDKSDEEEQK
jgi:predicted nuclease of restriction endonuclease-like (RecB) superfamily